MASPPTDESHVTLGKNFRLPLEVKPTRYRAELRVDMDAARFDGQLAIDLTLAAPRNAITLHAVEDVKSAVVDARGPAASPPRRSVPTPRARR